MKRALLIACLAARKTLEKLVEAVKVEIAQNNEKLGVGMFS